MSLTDLHFYGDGGITPPGGDDRFFDVFGAVTGAQAGAPLTYMEGVVPARLAASLHRRPNILPTVAQLTGSYRRQWQDELNEVGSAQMTIANEDDQSTFVRPGDVVRFVDDGYACFAWIIREINRAQIAEGEEHDQVTVFTGDGLLSMLTEGVVYPARGPDVKPFADERLFSWPSVDYTDDWWLHATELGGPYAGYWNEGIVNWPGSNSANWIWANLPNALEWAPGGPCYVRQTFTVPDGVRTLRMYLILDAEGDIYIDGQYQTSAYYDAEPVSPTELDIDITPGVHNVAIVCTNDVDPEADEIHNPGGVLFTCFGINSIGEYTPAESICDSNADWRIVEYPPYPPGMTPGEVMRHAVQEAQNRGALIDLTLGFTDELDSDGNPWPQYTNIATDCGTDVLTFFRELCNTYIDMWMEPAQFRLHAWVKGMRGSHIPDVDLHPPTDIFDPWSGNLAGLSYRRTD